MVVLVVASGASEGVDLLLVVALVVGEDLLGALVAMEVVVISIKTSTPIILAPMDSPVLRLRLL